MHVKRKHSSFNPNDWCLGHVHPDLQQRFLEHIDLSQVTKEHLKKSILS